jgi:peroxiredoxin
MYFRDLPFCTKRFAVLKDLKTSLTIRFSRGDFSGKKMVWKSLTVLCGGITFRNCIVADAGGTITYIRTGSRNLQIEPNTELHCCGVGISKMTLSLRGD